MLNFDLRDAVRGLIRDPRYSLVTVVTLALTIGATTAVFSIVNGVLLKPLAYRESHQLVVVREVVRELADHYPTLPANARHFDRWRKDAKSFESLAEFLATASTLTGAGEPAQVSVVRTSGTLFDVLGTTVQNGRTLMETDERPGSPDVAVVSHAAWRDRFASDPHVVGRAITIGGKAYIVVGVLPAAFQLPSLGFVANSAAPREAADVFVPLKITLADIGWVGEHNYAVIGRLRPGVSVVQATAELDVLQRGIAEIAAREDHQSVGLRTAIVPLADAVVGSARRGLLLLLGAIAAVLLIACSNLANLSLTRTVGRLREAAIRTALGASRERMVRRVVLEQLVLALCGGALGLGVAWAALRSFVRTAPVDLPRVGEVTLDARVMGFALAVSLVTGLLVAFVPAWRLAAHDVQQALRATALNTTSDRRGLHARGVLLAVQVALCVTLLVVTSLLGASFVRLIGVDPGFSSDHVLTIPIALPATRYADRVVRLPVYDRILEKVRTAPGVRSAAWTSALPLTGETWVDAISLPNDNRPFTEKPAANYRFVSPDYFRTLSIPVVRGRSFTDAERPPAVPAFPALVSARTASQMWPAGSAIGQRFTRADRDVQFEVVGIVPDGHMTQLDGPPPLMVYVPYWFRNESRATLVVRLSGDAGAATGAIRRFVWQVDGDIALGDARPLARLIDTALAGRRYQMTLFVVFGAIALLIAIIGVYAVTAYGVSRRRREMNIRVALGAEPRQVVGLIVRQGAVPVAGGVILGVLGAVSLAAVVSSLLFDVRARDPFIIASVAAAVGGIGLFACAAAARQGLALDPAAALREE